MKIIYSWLDRAECESGQCWTTLHSISYITYNHQGCKLPVLKARHGDTAYCNSKIPLCVHISAASGFQRTTFMVTHATFTRLTSDLLCLQRRSSPLTAVTAKSHIMSVRLPQINPKVKSQEWFLKICRSFILICLFLLVASRLIRHAMLCLSFTNGTRLWFLKPAG